MTYKAVDLVLTQTAVLARVSMAVIDCLEVIHVYTHMYTHIHTREHAPTPTLPHTLIRVR